MSAGRESLIRGTTILTVRRDGQVALGGDGQVTLGETVIKHDTHKIRKLAEGKILCGFAGSTADSFALLERFESKLEQYKGGTKRATIELAKEWRTDKVLRRLQSLLIVVDREVSLILSGQGDVIEHSYQVRLLDPSYQTDLLDGLHGIEGLSDTNLLMQRSTVEI